MQKLKFYVHSGTQKLGEIEAESIKVAFRMAKKQHAGVTHINMVKLDRGLAK